MKLKLLFTISVFAVAAASAQSPSKIVSQANKALGGEKALKAISSTVQTGKITRLSDNTTGSYSAFASGGSFYGSRYDLNGFEIAFGYNGKSGWVRRRARRR